MPRRRPPRVPSCPRCGNEEDLLQWLDGATYCMSCLACPHGIGGTTTVCPTCVRDLHTVMTFAGPRLTDVDLYLHDAWDEYGIEMMDLRGWTFDEEEAIGDRIRRQERPRVRSFVVTKPPPHHRLTSSGGSR